MFTPEFGVKQLLCWNFPSRTKQSLHLPRADCSAVMEMTGCKKSGFCYQHILTPARAELAELHTAGHLYTLRGVEMLSLNAGDTAVLGLVGQIFQV